MADEKFHPREAEEVNTLGVAPMNQIIRRLGRTVRLGLDRPSKLAETCLRKYYYKMIVGWQPERKSVHLLFGGWYASALESYHKYVADGMSQDEALAEVVQ
jgi:hypothetical protein